MSRDMIEQGEAESSLEFVATVSGWFGKDQPGYRIRNQIPDLAKLFVSEVMEKQVGGDSRGVAFTLSQEGEKVTLKTRIPDRWDKAIDRFARSKVLPTYLGEEYCSYYARHRRAESRQFHNVVPATDFDWYLRAV